MIYFFKDVFINPYKNEYSNLYKEETLEEIKSFLLQTLHLKNTKSQLVALKFLQKNPLLQKDENVWSRLEYLLYNSKQGIKMEILKLLIIEDPKTLKYLIDLYDDESSEIRHFVFDKISELKNFDLISSTEKLKLFYIGLSDNNQKVFDSALKLLKKFIAHLKIINIKSNKSNNNNNNMQFDASFENQKNEDNNNCTLNEKIKINSSPLKIKNKLQESPFGLFYHLDAYKYYNHPKLSYAFCLITAQLVELIDNDDLIIYISDIIANLKSLVDDEFENNNNNNNNPFKEKKNKRNTISFSTAKKEKANSNNDNDDNNNNNNDNYLNKLNTFNDLFFLQSKINLKNFLIIY